MFCLVVRTMQNKKTRFRRSPGYRQHVSTGTRFLTLKRPVGNLPLFKPETARGTIFPTYLQIKKLQQSTKDCCSRNFCTQNTPTHPMHRGSAEFTHSSRSPDLRIISPRTAFSGKFPMTDFRHMRGLHAYSGGTVPESHRIPLFSVEPERISTALK